jgi:hypothetical protein
LDAPDLFARDDRDSIRAGHDREKTGRLRVSLRLEGSGLSKRLGTEKFRLGGISLLSV